MTDLNTPNLPNPISVEGNTAGPPVRVGLERTRVPATADQSLWSTIRYTTRSISFDSYVAFLEPIMCGQVTNAAVDAKRRSLPFPGVDAYALLKAATEVFLMANCGVDAPNDPAAADLKWAAIEHSGEEAQRVGDAARAASLREDWDKFYRVGGPGGRVIPYLDLIRRKLGLPVVSDDSLGLAECYGVLQSKLTNPCMIELLWSYWHEEGMLVQTMNAITMRFQNRRAAGDRDPLATLEIDPLRALNQFLWGFVQDEQHRLTVVRRAYEYDHHYGFTLEGKAVPKPRTVDSRSKFLEAFHTLLYLCTKFYLEDDDTTRIADGFPLLNALKEVHLVLTEGGHNQYGDLPWNARLEMMMTQWLLARQEMREFIGGRIMVAYPETWMDRVDAMKSLQGWTDTNITHFRDLGIFGEQVLLAVRFGAWSTVILPEQAANWARYWRPEIQGYIHAYRAATGVDLSSAPPSDPKEAASRYTPPSTHLASRLAAQQRKR
jgi:hypothetical protein